MVAFFYEIIIMNKKITYFFLIAFFVFGTAFIIFRYERGKNNKEISYYELKDRKGPLALSPEWAKTKNMARTAFRSMAENPGDTKSALALATIFIQEARVTGDNAYYDQAAMNQVNKVLEIEPENFQALTFKSMIYLSQHHFAEGLEIANEAQKINTHNPFIYGLLIDGNVEMGNYDEAVKFSDKMVSLRPDIRSYSRISYLREIFGDYPGAIEAMKLAVEAGLPGQDNTEWTRIQLGHLYENVGKFDSAGIQYAQSLFYRPGYAPAISGLGHVAYVQKDFKKAIGYYQQADTLATDYTVKEMLAQLYKITGDQKKSDSLAIWIVNAMSGDANAAATDDNVGHYVDRELAVAYLNIGDNRKALEHATAEYNRRPKNIDVNETMAWVYYHLGDYKKAREFIETALKTNCKNPTLLCYAGLIYAKAGDKTMAHQYLMEGLKNKPGIDIGLTKESMEVLSTL